MRFRHDIDEIMKEVEWRINEEKLAAEEEEKIKDIEDDADVDDLREDDNGSEGNDYFVESDQTGDGDGSNTLSVPSSCKEQHLIIFLLFIFLCFFLFFIFIVTFQ